MLKILKYLNEHKGAVCCIVLLMILQAYCDLSLPRYTADIVDIGIQQGGIDNVAPDEMREETMSHLLLFLTDEEAELVRTAYVKGDNGNYVLQSTEKELLSQLNQELGIPVVILSNLDAAQLEKITALDAAGQWSEAERLKIRRQTLDALGDTSQSIIDQKALLFVQKEYAVLGIDMGKVQTDYLWKTGGKMLGLSIVMMASAILVGLLASRTGAKIGKSLREQIFKKVVSFSNKEMDQFSTASLITRSTNDIRQVQMVSVMLLRMVVYAPIIGIGGIIMVTTTKTGMSWIIAVAVVLIVSVVAILQRIAMPKFKMMQSLIDRLNLVAREILTGLSVIRAFSREKHEEARFADANHDLMQTQLFTSRVMSVMMPAMMLIMNGITVLIVWFGAQGIEMGNLQVGDMMAFMTYTMQIVMSFLMLTMVSIMLPRAGVAAGRIEEVIHTESSIVDKISVLDDSVTQWQGRIVFEDVSFRYPGADEDALQHISFIAESGKTTAIIGSTGCGKSTLLQLILRFYDVTSGRIILDGIDIRDLSQHKLRSLLGYVPQKGVLFSGNIASNLKFSGADVTDAMMQEAAEIAQASAFIAEKEYQYQSPIAQGGGNVSGGQKQRLSIARAIVKQPKVFLFDDSFSALDYKTDAALRRTLYEKIKDVTVLIVAQRISTILHADQIVVLEDGRIAGIGTHEQLLEQCDAYLEIARSQLSEAELKGGRKDA